MCVQMKKEDQRLEGLFATWLLRAVFRTEMQSISAYGLLYQCTKSTSTWWICSVTACGKKPACAWPRLPDYP